MPSLQIQCVVVLYKMNFEQSQTMRSLLACCMQQPGLGGRLSVLVYDNSPQAQQSPASTDVFGLYEYRHNADNGGLALAYETALEKARALDISWLLLLDQDTRLEGRFFQSLLETLEEGPQAHVCALVPRLVQDGRIISPQIVGRFHNRPPADDFSGGSLERLTALNSGACLRVDSVFAVGGFPRTYPLDYLDHAMFYRLQAGLSRVLVLDVSMEHQLSLNNIEEEMSMARYTSVLAAEWAFIRESGSGGGTMVHRVRLLTRAVRHYSHLGNKSYALQALRSVFL